MGKITERPSVVSELKSVENVMEWAILPERVEMIDGSSQQTDQQRREAPINNRRQNVRYVRKDNVSDNDDQEDDMPFGMYKMQSANIDSRVLVPVMLNGDTKVNFELDTGAWVSVVSE